MNKKLTNPDGVLIENDNDSLTVNKPGKTYTFLEDKLLIEKLAHFVRERIPERIVHAKGAGAHGTFTCTNDMSKYTKAKLFTKGTKTPIFVRFSTVAGELGSSDTVRDPRGFAVKFYTNEGNYDIVGNNTPIFFIRDGMKFPDFIHSQKRNPKTHLRDPNMAWDFLSLTPESIHQVTILFSSRGTPMTYRHMHGFSSHAFMWYTSENDYVWVKYHFKTEQGIKNFTEEESIEMSAKNPDFATQDLYEAIANKTYPKWKLCVQIVKNDDLNKFDFDPFDVTKTWSQKDFPLIEVGEMVLDRNPIDYFSEVEQVAFSPARLIPGIAPSPDKMLQARLFSYEDAQRYRLGANYQQLPINAPKVCPYSNQRDGAMNFNNYEGTINFTPSTLNGSFSIDDSNKIPQIDLDGCIKGRFHPNLEETDYIQAKDLFENVLDGTEQSKLIHNMSSSIKGANKNIQYRWTAICYKTSEKYGTMLANALNLDLIKVKQLASMNQTERVKATVNSF